MTPGADPIARFAAVAAGLARRAPGVGWAFAVRGIAPDLDRSAVAGGDSTSHGIALS